MAVKAEAKLQRPQREVEAEDGSGFNDCMKHVALLAVLIRGMKLCLRSKLGAYCFVLLLA